MTQENPSGGYWVIADARGDFTRALAKTIKKAADETPLTTDEDAFWLAIAHKVFAKHGVRNDPGWLEGEVWDGVYQILRECGYNFDEPHPECYRGFSYVKLASILGVAKLKEERT
jgi:hypothetical protein